MNPAGGKVCACRLGYQFRSARAARSVVIAPVSLGMLSFVLDLPLLDIPVVFVLSLVPLVELLGMLPVELFMPPVKLLGFWVCTIGSVSAGVGVIVTEGVGVTVTEGVGVVAWACCCGLGVTVGGVSVVVCA